MPNAAANEFVNTEKPTLLKDITIGKEVRISTNISAQLFMPIEYPITDGRTPKQTKSQRESICIPNFFSSSVLFRVRATLPSNISKRPESIRQTIAYSGCEPDSPIPEAKYIPKAEETRLK